MSHSPSSSQQEGDEHAIHSSDPVRGQDSFKTFKEILQIAKDQQVDFILLGGDLFHHNRPSRSCLYKTMKMLREYCFGEKESKVWIASDQSVNFGEEFSKANYLDENINISLPVFSIHGNHDNPSGVGNLCALNLLSVSGMMNYFGSSSSIEDVVIHPILMQKGRAKLALYGLGNIREERLHRQWRSGRVKFMRPEDDGTVDSWTHCFNMFVFHQNRARHGPTSHIPEEFLDGFLDLVFWGHEHECRIHPEQYQNFSITQPGSSVATSLTLGESEPKHVGILTIEEGNIFDIEKIKLKTIRPLQFTSVVLSQVETITPTNVKSIQTYLEGVVESLIERAKVDWESENPSIEMPIPLVRIRVDYSGGYETFNTQQFGQKFIKRVANPKDMLKFQRSTTTSSNNSLKASEMLNDLSTSIPERLDKLKVEDLVSELLKKDLFILPETQLEEAVMTLVEKSDKNAISLFVKKSVSQTRESITVLPEDVQDLTIEYIKRKSTESKQSQDNQHNNNNSTTSTSVRPPFTTTSSSILNDAVSPIPSLRGNTTNNDNNNNDEDLFHISSSSDNEEEDPLESSPSPPPTRGRGSRGGARGSTRGARGTRGTRGARGARGARGTSKRSISPSPSPPSQAEAESSSGNSSKRRRVLPKF
ncbi:unnamed protein product [Mucor hiemalis]